jgi:hypothetical protein
MIIDPVTADVVVPLLPDMVPISAKPVSSSVKYQRADHSEELLHEPLSQLRYIYRELERNRDGSKDQRIR